MAVLVISYSRVDQKQVRALVTLLKGGLRGVDQAVYWDDQFEPGEPWFEQLKTHIDASPQLFVFWCAHSSASQEVKREFAYALERKKRVVPVLLDETPLAPELAPIAGIDLRGAVQHAQGTSVALGADTPAPRAPGLRVAWLAAAVTLVLAVGTGAFFMLRTQQPEATADQAGFPSDSAGSGSPPPPASGGVAPSPAPAVPMPSVTITMQPSTATAPDDLTEASRAEIDRMFRDVPSSQDVRIAIRGSGRSTATRARNEAIQKYIAARHNVPLGRIQIEYADALTGGLGVSSGRTTISLQTIGRPNTGSAAGPGPPIEPAPVEPVMAPPSVEPRTDRAGVLAIAAVVAVIAIAAAVRMLSAWRKRRTIVREFERYWVDSLD